MSSPCYFFHVAFDLYQPSTAFLLKTNHIRNATATSKEAAVTERYCGNGAVIEYEDFWPSGQPDASEDARQGVAHDWRAGQILTTHTDISISSGSQRTNEIMPQDAPPSGQDSSTTHDLPEAASLGSSGARFGTSLHADTTRTITKGRFEPVNSAEEDLGWGIIRLYRDHDETPGLYDEVQPKSKARHGRAVARQGEKLAEPSFKDEDCTTLCILAVPSYIRPADFMGFVGERTRDDVSHFQMIRTDRINRYMVLMKFRNGKRAREWRTEWNGKPFDDIGTEICHVVFIKSIKMRTQPSAAHADYFPYLINTPFSFAISDQLHPPTTATITTKPIAPPTPALKELPICPVCLERMDESTGLLTILCQHVFHCTCLEKWRGTGCPVCRYTQEEASARHGVGPEDTPGLNACAICQSDANLWVCLICGHVGCGRYDAAHAFLHYKQTSHCFAMDLATQRVWDYDSDGYVHRIMQSKTDGKLLELPSAAANYNHNPLPTTEEDSVPREKIEALGLEYTHLLTSQLESQRLYFEEKLEQAVDKASHAMTVASTATDGTERAVAELSALQARYDAMITGTLPETEKERDRLARKSEKFESMARRMEQSWREEKTVAESLMERLTFLNERVEQLGKENEDLKETNRDMGFFISGQEKLKEMELGDEITQATATVPEETKKKGKGKGRKR